MSPCLEVGIGMAYVPADRAEVGTELEIDVRGKLRRAVVAKKPLYTK
jgi:aminomethyltransferase